MYRILKFFLFRLSAEDAHRLTTFIFDGLCSVFPIRFLIEHIFKLEHDQLKFSLWGLNFKNPVGLAAGFDKNGDHIRSMSTLGFGFIEVGTITPLPQGGNPKPRLFRLPSDNALINRMGFNNKGVEYLVNQLKRLKKSDLIIGGNIGKNKNTPNDKAYQDYLTCFSKLYSYVDYFVVNLSSPNTPGLRQLQEKEPLRRILETLLNYRQKQLTSKPIVLKISPDLSDGQLRDVIDIVSELNIDGIVATNTTTSRSGLKTNHEKVHKIGNGGLSGQIIFEKSNQLIKKVALYSANNIPVVGVGGIHSADSAIQKFRAGALLIQLYSGLIFEGPFLVKKIKKKILEEGHL